MRRTLTVVTLVMALALSMLGTALAATATPSTNEANAENGWAHFIVGDVGVGEVDIKFVSERNFVSCFEYRSDGEPPTSDTNPNPAITDGLWRPFTCVTNTTADLTLTADEYVEIRMVFGAERDERFDWTRVDVGLAPKDACMDGGFADLGFRNQGLCIASFQANPGAGR